MYHVLIGSYGIFGLETFLGIFDSVEALEEGKQHFLTIQTDRPELWEFRVEPCEINTIYYESCTDLW